MSHERFGRRRFLQTAGALGLAAAAGCVSQGSSGQQPDEGDDGESSPEPLNQDLPLTSPPTTVDLSEQGFETTLKTVGARHHMVTPEADGGPITLPEVWAWAADDRDPSVPGPRFEVPQGEAFQLHFENTHERPHTIHVHALEKEWLDDGVPSTTGVQVNPGEIYTYDLVADVPGPHFYHCHVQTDTHLDMGMYGLIYVVPEDDDPPDREYFLTLKEWDTDLHHSQAGADVEYDSTERNPAHYTINGRSAPSTYHPEKGCPMMVSEGERVRIHVGNAGYENHSFHTHAHRFEVVAKDGTPVPPEARSDQDVVSLAPAERVTLEFEADADPGIYPVHCHKVDHVTNDGVYPGGMATAIAYEGVTDTEQFQAVMEKAGAAE